MKDPYVFHCTPCGHAHAGECPPSAATEPGRWMAPGVPALGSKWRRDMLPPKAVKKRGGWVYTVYKIEGDRVSYSITSMGSQVHGGTMPLSGWTSEGYLDQLGIRHWMMPVCARHSFKAAPVVDLSVVLTCTKCDTVRRVGMLSLLDLQRHHDIQKPLDTDPGP